MSTLSCNFAEFKQLGKQFCDAAKTANFEELEAGFKCIGLSYLGLGDLTEVETVEAPVLMRILGRIYLNRQFELIGVKVQP